MERVEEKSEFKDGYEDVNEWEIEYEINRLLLKYDCLTIN
jgi:hypothetical protein